MASNLLPPCKCHLQPLTLRCGAGSTKDFLKRDLLSIPLLLKAHVPEASGRRVQYLAGVSISLLPEPQGTDRVCCQLAVRPLSIKVEGILRFSSKYLTLQRRWQVSPFIQY